LIREAHMAGLEKSPDAVLAALQDEQVKLQKFGRSNGIGRLKSFLQSKEAALRYGRNDDYWTYALSHEMVHGSDVCCLSRSFLT